MNKEEAEYYGEYTEILTYTEQEILKELNDILDELTEDPERSPYEHIISRIKSPESVRDKLRQKGFADDVLTGIIKLSDVIGIRVVTHFVGDIYLILSKLREHEAWEIVKEKDYIARPKENGYRSYHVILKVPVCREDDFTKSKDFPDSLNIEIQLRTIAMDCWAALEHQIRYKKDVKNTVLIADELKRCADEMASTDLTMQTIRDVLMK